MFRAGDKIGPYVLINRLGEGAFGVVWLAERRTPITTTKVALKIPLDEDVDLDVIKREAAVWVQASGHPNVLPIIDADVYDGQVVIVSEYAPDGSLNAWLMQNGGRAPSTKVGLEMLSGILAGLAHLHARGIIHRDLKPDNILLQGEIPRIADFGIARLLRISPQSSIVMGTPVYMAPEAFSGHRFAQTDVWSAGVIAYQLLTGRLPFPRSNIETLMKRIKTDDPVPLPDSVPNSLKEIIAYALQKDLNERFRSATEMQAELRKVSWQAETDHETWTAERDKEYERVADKKFGALFLAHGYKPSTLPGARFDVTIFLIRHRYGDPNSPYKQGFSDIKHAKFYLGPSWGHKVFLAPNDGGLIGIRISASGTFLATCQVTFTDGKPPLILHRFIDFEMAPPPAFYETADVKIY